MNFFRGLLYVHITCTVLPFWSASSYFKKKYMDLPQIDRCYVFIREVFFSDRLQRVGKSI